MRNPSILKTLQGVTINPERDLKRFKEINGSDIKFMIAICTLSNDSGVMELSPTSRQKMMQIFDIGKATLSGKMSELREKGLIKIYNHTAMVNPDYMYKGSQKDYNVRKKMFEKIEQALKIKGEVKTYIMIDLTNGYYKIGKSDNPIKREKTLQSEKPMIELLHVIDKNVEAKLHKQYAGKRVRGEWFNLATDDIEEIINGNGNNQTNEQEEFENDQK
jgi:hypothetical protein